MGLVKIAQILRQGGQLHIEPGFKCLERILEPKATDEPFRRNTDRSVANILDRPDRKRK
jgi:hypothetical protein